jgi:hypothetical protein
LSLSPTKKRKSLPFGKIEQPIEITWVLPKNRHKENYFFPLLQNIAPFLPYLVCQKTFHKKIETLKSRPVVGFPSSSMEWPPFCP